MKRIILTLAALVLAGQVEAQIEFRPAGGGVTTRAGLTVTTKTVTISAVRSRTLFSDPIEFLPVKAGYAYWPTYCILSHGTGTNHTTTSVTHFGAYWDNGSMLANCTATTANFFGSGTQETIVQIAAASASNVIYSKAELVALALSGKRVLLRTAGADLSGSGTYNITFTMEYIEIPVPLPEVP